MSEQVDGSDDEDYGGRKCNCWGVYELIVMLVFVFLSSYGLTKILEGCGMVVWYDGAQHFWFEEDVRRWIHSEVGE
jgi:hypothetical protein